MILANLPAFQVVIPLLAAPACVLLQRPALAWGLSQTGRLAMVTIFFAFAGREH